MIRDYNLPANKIICLNLHSLTLVYKVFYVFSSFYARYPCGTVVHYGCCKDPKTQLERTSSLSSLSKSLTDQDLEFSLSESLTDDDLENSDRSGFKD